tara:strand:+ start:660 stop:845 length:186 start_codon:yes stop_codon:yes gene_type:complete
MFKTESKYDNIKAKEYTVSKIFNTFAYKVKYNITQDDVKQYIAKLNTDGYKVTKYYLSNIR